MEDEKPDVGENLLAAKVDDEASQAASENITYYESGETIFTDPTTKYKYKWNKEANEWKPVENEHYKWCNESQKWITKTSTENEFYRWCDKGNQWIPKMSGKEGITYGYDEKEGCHTYTDKDGVVFFFDNEKKAWFPKVDDDFLALYQLNYGFNDITSKEDDKVVKSNVETSEVSTSEAASTTNLDEQPQTSNEAKKRKAPPAPPKWFELPPEQNTKVYVSNLPLDIKEEEFSELMGKCGMVIKDLKTGKLKLKLYRDSNGQIKGDGLCHYIKIESVELALNVLDGYDVRDKKISVQRAEFQMRGEYNPALKPRMKKQEKEKMKKIQEKLFDWRPEKTRGERAKHERTVIIKNLFEPELFDREVQLILEYQNDLREECGKCGTVRKVVVYDRHPEGIAQITMGDAEEADLVIQLMNGRFFGQRKLSAEAWDGKIKYKIDESEADKNERLAKWQNYLETEDAKKELAERNQQMDGDGTKEEFRSHLCNFKYVRYKSN
ncbi:CLUMA_CG009535, isoform A [Clunio marinus]|uniref:17S U2 SnRNP complex component HTATSF1 n=1 Tax=Clunio marinus TaxID=568069 RepID=A0A1J1I7E8_9DIPT|nr:CLUMA_CG009535, isoform A [Clunio marinus]